MEVRLEPGDRAGGALCGDREGHPVSQNTVIFCPLLYFQQTFGGHEDLGQWHFGSKAGTREDYSLRCLEQVREDGGTLDRAGKHLGSAGEGVLLRVVGTEHGLLYLQIIVMDAAGRPEGWGLCCT